MNEVMAFNIILKSIKHLPCKFRIRNTNQKVILREWVGD